MDDLYDYKKFAILYVDDEEKSLKYFHLAYESHFRIFTASNAQEGLALLQQHKDEIGILMTDQRMPGEKGVWLLEKARDLRPQMIRILVTAYADMEAAIAAVNSGAIYKYVTKPWDPPQLEFTLKRGLEFFMVQRERDQLLKEKTSILHDMMIADRVVGLGLLAAGMSHHIRNSLVAVKTFLDLAPGKLQEEKLDLNGLRNPDFWKDYYQKVQQQIEKINNLLKDLWAVSEKPTFKFDDRVDLKEVVSEVISRLSPLLKEKKILVENAITGPLPALAVDKAKFYSLFELLLKDEMVSLPAGCVVTLRAKPLVRDSQQPYDVEVTVEDDGPGLPPEAVRVLFDPFVVRSDSPMEYGISLMACYFIIHHHGGKIEAASQEGKGTTFTLRLLADPNRLPLGAPPNEFLQKVIVNNHHWEKLLASH